MQLNVYVPKEKAEVMERLAQVARRTGKQKNQLVLEALEAYLASERPQLGVFHLGHLDLPTREELYGERTSR